MSEVSNTPSVPVSELFVRTPSDEEIVAYVLGHYSRAMAQSVSDELEQGGHFAEHIRWSFIREMGDPIR